MSLNHVFSYKKSSVCNTPGTRVFSLVLQSIYEVVLKDEAVSSEIKWSHLMVDVASNPVVML